MLVRAPRHGKMTSASNRGPDQVQSTVTPIIYRLFHYRSLNSGCMSSQGLQRIHGSCWDHASFTGSKKQQKKQVTELYKSQNRPSFSKRFQHTFKYHVLNASPVHASTHLHTSKGCQHIENRAQDKRTSLINIIECIQSAGSIHHLRSPYNLDYNGFNGHTADKWDLSGSTCMK